MWQFRCIGFVAFVASLVFSDVTGDQFGRPFDAASPEHANTVKRVGVGKRDTQLEAVIEVIQFIQTRKLPRGLILRSDNMMQSPITTKLGKECNKLATEVLGSGNSAGDITVFTDEKTKKKMALKSIIISQFNPDEIRLWILLGDLGLAPELYHFELFDNNLYLSMEIMTGKDLQKVIDENMPSFSDSSLARDFSLSILHDLLVIWEKMRSLNFIHGDMHAGNLRLEESMKVKIFDFGRAKNSLNLNKDQSQRSMKQDIVGIIRVFSSLYSGFDFNDVYHAYKVLNNRNLNKYDESMGRISKENRNEMYKIMYMLYDTVKTGAEDTCSNSFGDTTPVLSYVKSLIKTDMKEISHEAKAYIFPKKV